VNAEKHGGHLPVDVVRPLADLRFLSPTLFGIILRERRHWWAGSDDLASVSAKENCRPVRSDGVHEPHLIAAVGPVVGLAATAAARDEALVRGGEDASLDCVGHQGAVGDMIPICSVQSGR